jgi:hemerythrin-like domain-containing protein
MLCLRIRRGLPQHRYDETWVRKKAAQAAQFFATNLAEHFRAEEDALFPAMRALSGAAELLSKLCSEHRELEALAELLIGTEAPQLIDVLAAFAELLEAHIRREEHELFPLYEMLSSPDVSTEVGRAIKNIIGDAMQPKIPELLN